MTDESSLGHWQSQEQRCPVSLGDSGSDVIVSAQLSGHLSAYPHTWYAAKAGHNLSGTYLLQSGSGKAPVPHVVLSRQMENRSTLIRLRPCRLSPCQ